MHRTYCAVLFIQCIFINYCLGELNSEKKDQVLNGFIGSLNNLPNQIYTYDEGALLDAQKTNDNSYKISARLKASDLHNVDTVKILRCCGTVVENENNVLVLQPGHVCTEETDSSPTRNEGNVEASVEDNTMEITTDHGPVQLFNEVQSDAEVTSGEQFVAIPRASPSSPCIGCASHVDPTAVGVPELANLGVRHLDLHDPGTKHELRAVLDVERQVQVVNGVRYILTLVIDFNNCSAPDAEPCPISTTCQVSILEKPWKKLADGSKYRAIIANNCTAQWLFGDEGEVLPIPENNENNEIHPDPLNPDGIKVVHNLDVQASPNQGQVITDEHLKNIEEQIIPYSEFQASKHHVTETATDKKAPSLESTEPEHKDEQVRNYNENAAIAQLPAVNEPQSLSEDKKKAIDDMMHFLDFAGFGKPEVTGSSVQDQRSKRSLDDDLKLLALSKKWQKKNKALSNANHMQKLAQKTVDYLNKIDMIIQNRVLKDILAVEEEIGNNQHFVYMQTLVNIPCDKAQCTAKDRVKQICNGVIDNTDKKIPIILSAFCYSDKEDNSFNKEETVSFDDPILVELVKQAVNKIESEAPRDNAMKLIKVLDATTQKASGTLTKISIILAYLNCEKSVDFNDRMNCNIIEEMGTNVCEVEIHGKYIDKNLQIGYVCTERKIHESLTDLDLLKGHDHENNEIPGRNVNNQRNQPAQGIPGGQQEQDVTNPNYKDLARESFNKFRKSYVGDDISVKDIQVTKVTTQVVSGIITRINFNVLATEGDAISCHSKIWEQSWVQKKEIKVDCDLNYRKNRTERGILGGEQEQSTNDQKYIELAHESFNKYRETQVGGHELNVKEIKVTKVTTQVVSGQKTKIDFNVLATHDDSITCHSEIWEQAWLKKKEIKVDCNLNNRNKRNTGGIPGGEQEQSVDDQKYIELAHESFTKYRESQVGGSELNVKEIKVTKVTTQVVAGQKTKIDFNVLATNDDSITCHSEIWEQAWLNKKEIKVDCNLNDRKRRHTRGIRGGVQEQSVDDQKYIELAHESFTKYRESQVGGSELNVKEIKVTKVTTQVVAGQKTKIDFNVLATNDDSITCHSEIWEQAWLKKKEIKVDCNLNNRNKRNTGGIPGGEQEQSVDDQKYIELAHESFTKYRESQVGGSELNVKEIKVTKVTTQVVAGQKTKIDFNVLATNDDSITCHSEIWEQAWLNKKEIKVDCNLNNRKKRNTGGILGGEQEQSINDQKYIELAHESFTKYRETQVGGHELNVKEIKVTKVTTQVVSGQKTKIDFNVLATNDDSITCHSEIWEQSWLKKKEIKVDCNLNNRNKRNTGGIPGGEQEQSVDDQKYIELAHESFTKYRESQVGGSELNVKEIKVTKVTTQVVAGQKTKIDFNVLATNDDSITCHSEIWEQAWLNKKEIKVDCNLNDRKRRHTRGIRGGVQEQSVDDQKYIELAHESFTKYRESQVGGSELNVKEIKVTKVTKQVVAGLKTKIDFNVLATNDDSITCHSEIWEQAWLNKKEIKVDCNLNNRKKRNTGGIPGGEQEQSINDQKYIELAHESFTKYRETQVGGHELNVKEIKVTKVTTQVVSGQKTKIDFNVLATNDDSITCHSEIWEQAWLKKKDIEVNCDVNKPVNKRSVTGNQREQDVNDEEYKKLAHESFNKYRQSEIYVKELKINKVTKQVVSGVIIRIDFDVISTKDDVINCHSQIWEQAWLNKKDITVECNMNNPTQPTVQLEKNVDDPMYTKLAEESLAEYRKSLVGGELNVKELKVTKVTTQVVSGIKTGIDFDVYATNGDVITCHSEILEQASLEKKNITVNCGLKDQEARKRREIFRDNPKKYKTGSIQNEEASKAKFQLLANESLQKYMKLQDNPSHHEVVEVKHVVTQVVAGMVYEIDFTAAPSSCSINDANQPKCVAQNDTLLLCHARIWSRPWLKSNEVDVTCEKNNNAGDQVGQQIKKERNDDELRNEQYQQEKKDKDKLALAQEVLHHYERQSNSKYKYKLNSVEESYEQITDSILSIIRFYMSPTQCLINDETNIDECKLRNPVVTLLCKSTVRERPWIYFKDIKVTCTNEKTTESTPIDWDDETPGVEEIHAVREKRYVTGDDEDEYLDDDMKFYYAERAIQYINDRMDSHNLQKLITIHSVDASTQMGARMIRMYIETAKTFCVRHQIGRVDINQCDEMDGLPHRLCHVRLWPSPNEEMVIRHVVVLCDDHPAFASVTGFDIAKLISASLRKLESSPHIKNKLVHQGEPYIMPSLSSKYPIKMNFIVLRTNCTKDTDVFKNRDLCYLDTTAPAASCESQIYLSPNSKEIKNIKAKCADSHRQRRDIYVNPVTMATDDNTIAKLVDESLEKLETSSLHRYKQKVVKIVSYNTKITRGRLTTIKFDVGYTTCMKYEFVKNISDCEFLNHLPKRHCTSRVYERLWVESGKNIEVFCVDDDTPLESQISPMNTEMANQIATEALRHIEAKYPNPKRLKIVRIFSLQKQAVAGIHYRLKMEVGITNCPALSVKQYDCKLVQGNEVNKFCRVNVWIRPWTEHPPNYRVTCDYQENESVEIYHEMQAEHLFANFIRTHRPDYMNDHKEMARRFKIFRDNVRKVHEMNIHERGSATYGMTRFSDLTYEEFSNKYLGLKPSLRSENDIPMIKADIPKVDVPQSFDWRERGAVTDVKDQGSCGSCWAFSVTGNVEGQWKLHTGKLVSLSEQELVDCDKKDQGCNGGLMDNAYRAIEELGGLETENDYPYEGEDDKCVFNQTLSRVQISGAVNISSNETEMTQWLVTGGPISIGINANAMQFYVGGISHPWKMLCSPKNLDHGVLIVGYGVKNYPLFNKRLPYWIVKNSWGKSWGEQGYYRVYRGDGTCGVNQMASSAVV